MRKVERLKKLAMKSAKFRGHSMLRYMALNTEKSRWFSSCRVCCRNVVVVADVSPLPNGIEIGGEAVAVVCTLKQADTEMSSRRDFIVRMERDWEDQGCVFRKGLRLFVHDGGYSLSDFWYTGMHVISKKHCSIES